jgi:ribosomal protein S18 acetylase RimI-like enzyme
MDYAQVVLDGEAEWFELLARTWRPSKRMHGALAVTTGVRSNTENGIAVDPTTVDLDDLEIAIDWLRSSGLPASCVLVKPSDSTVIGKLIALGLRADDAGNEMGRSLAGYEAKPSVQTCDIVEATTAAELFDGLVSLGDEWYDHADRDEALRLYLEIGLGAGSPVRHWTARVQNTTVALATSFCFADVVVLLHCGVDAAHRRRGIATALTHARLSSAMASGARTAVLSPSPDGYELHRQLGFELVSSHPNRWFHI